jgi:hypothetical protein
VNCSLNVGNSVAKWLKCCATNRKVADSIPAGVNGIFYWHKILPIAIWPWGRLSLWQKWVQWAFSGGKGDRCVRLTTLPPSCAVVTKSGNINFLEPRPLTGLLYLYSLNVRTYFIIYRKVDCSYVLLTDGILLLTCKKHCRSWESPTTVISHYHGDLDKQDLYMFKTM